MMLGERHRVTVPPWARDSNPDDNAAGASDYNPYYLEEALGALQRYLPSNEPEIDSDSEIPGLEQDSAVDAVLPQQSPRSVDSYDGSPLRQAMEAAACVKVLPFLSSPSSISPPPTPPAADSPPMSPMLSRSVGSNSINEMVASLRNLQLGKMRSLPSSWNVQVGGSGFGSPRSGSVLRPGFCSLPTTPTSAPTRSGLGYRDMWDDVIEEPAMERVESGRGLRAKMFEKLSKENSLGRVEPDPAQSGSAPDVGWVSELVM
ncbi:hypothetical protein RCOM_1048570 [Ricinus communis]|uniref:Uncharacterized protein n=1 Tax=Ricinus communis TaxID=3988 RepID=B9RKE0_RICCO|nr:hypothetical protein RCOM_1048570 [Ricinus communis]